EKTRNVQRRVDSGNDEVKTPNKFFQCSILLRVVHVMSAQLPRFRLLAVTGGEGMNLAAPFVSELERHMSQPTDANDPYTGSGRHIMKEERCKHSDAAAQQGSHFCQVKRIRQRTNPCPLGSDTVRKAAVASDNGPLSSGAQVLIAGKAFVACEA